MNGRTGTDQTKVTSRRRVLATTAALASATVSLSGCLSVFDDDEEELPALDLDERDVLAVAEIEVPAQAERLPVDLSSDHVEASRDRSESLLSVIPENLTDEVPNEAVRRTIIESQNEAQDSLEEVSEASSASTKLSSLRGARRDAAAAEGMYAVAAEDRTREDAFEEAAILRDERADLKETLSLSGEDAQKTALVYNEVERLLDSAERFLGSELDQIAPMASEVEAVRVAAGAVERAHSQLEDATYLDENQPGDEQFTEVYRSASEALLAESESRAEEFPEEADDFLDTDFDGLIRTDVDRLLRATHNDPDRIQSFLDDGQVARALRQAYWLVHTLDTLDRLDERDDVLVTPDSADDLRDAKQEALDEVDQLDIGDDSLRIYGINRVINVISGGDWHLEQLEERSVELDGRGSRYAIEALVSYVVAGELARTIPETTETVLDAIEEHRDSGS